MPFYTMSDHEKLYVRRVGRGKPVLVLSGLGMVSWQWLPFIVQHLNQYEFIIPDWRGFGRSKHCQIPTELDAISSHWQDLYDLIKQLDLKQFAVIAYSMGATTAMHGLKYGNLAQYLSGYLQIDQTPKIQVDTSWQFGLFGSQHQQFYALLQQMYELLLPFQHLSCLNELDEPSRYKLVNLWKDFINLQNNNRFAPVIFKVASQKPALQKYLLPIQRIDYLFWYVRSYLFHEEDYRTAISTLACPTTFFVGAQSRLYAKQGQTQVAQSVAHSKLIYFHKSGHTPLISEPIKFSKEIYAFLQDLK